MYVTQFNWRLPFLKGWDKIGLLFLRGVPISTTYLVKFQRPLQDFHLFPVIFYHNHLASGLLASHLFLCSAGHGSRLNPILFQLFWYPLLCCNSVLTLSTQSYCQTPQHTVPNKTPSPWDTSSNWRPPLPPYFWPTWLQIQTVPKCPSGFIIQ